MEGKPDGETDAVPAFRGLSSGLGGGVLSAVLGGCKQVREGQQ